MEPASRVRLRYVLEAAAAVRTGDASGAMAGAASGIRVLLAATDAGVVFDADTDNSPAAVATCEAEAVAEADGAADAVGLVPVAAVSDRPDVLGDGPDVLGWVEWLGSEAAPLFADAANEPLKARSLFKAETTVVPATGAFDAAGHNSQPSTARATTATSAAKNCHTRRRTARAITASSSSVSRRSQASRGKGVGSGSGGFSRWNALSISLSDHITSFF
jgi:hypothetical protein